MVRPRYLAWSCSVLFSRAERSLQGVQNKLSLTPCPTKNKASRYATQIVLHQLSFNSVCLSWLQGNRY